MPPGYLMFKDVLGVRILREGDLLEFWQSERPDGWLWEVQSGGWSALERSRNGFITGHSSGIREFLVAGLVEGDEGLALTPGGIEMCKSLQHRVAADAQVAKTLEERENGDAGAPAG